jgi:hypothetical protein
MIIGSRSLFLNKRLAARTTENESGVGSVAEIAFVQFQQHRSFLFLLVVTESTDIRSETSIS